MSPATACYHPARVHWTPDRRNAATLFLTVAALHVPALITAEAFLVVDGHRCLDAIHSSRGGPMECDPVDAYAGAVMSALFEAGHIAVDARIEVALPSARGAEWLLGSSGHDATLGDEYGDALRLARDAGANVLVLVLGQTTRRGWDQGGIDAVAYTAHLVTMVIDIRAGRRLGGDVRTDEFIGADSPVVRRDLARRSSAAVAERVVAVWRQSSSHRQQETT